MSSSGPRTRSADPAGPGSPYELLKQAIVDGEFGPGAPLVEASLAERLSVSRTPVREALSRLEQDGLAERTASGLVVRAHTREQILDIYQTRTVLEGMAAELAADRRSEFDLRNIEAIARAAGQVDPADPRAMAGYNKDFHHAVWRASHNETAIDLLQRLELHLSRYPETTLSFPGRWEESLKEHQALADAIRRRDAEEARQQAVGHFQAAREIRLQLWFDNPLHD